MFPFIEYLQATVELLIGLTLIFLCLRESRAPRREKALGKWLVSGIVKTHTFIE